MNTGGTHQAKDCLRARCTAAALGMMIFYTAATVRFLHYLVSALFIRMTQQWLAR